jgi:hypothetical protein
MEKARSIANIANNITPPHGKPILEYYNGYYNCVYIILHPFIKITHSDKIKFSNKKWPTKEDYVRYTQKVSWAELLNLSGLVDINRLDIALRNSIHGLNKIHSNDIDLNILRNTIEINNLIEPGEGHFSELLIDDMLNALKDIGHEWIYVGDEHGFERKIEYIQDIIDNKLPIGRGHENWYTTMNEVLYTTHWDSHFTFLCSDKKTVDKILEKYPFEGFYCGPDTEIYWSLNSKQ